MKHIIRRHPDHRLTLSRQRLEDLLQVRQQAHECMKRAFHITEVAITSLESSDLLSHRVIVHASKCAIKKGPQMRNPVGQ